MQYLTYRIPWPKDDRPILIKPIGDIQWNGDEQQVALEYLQRDIEEHAQQGAHFLLTGDYTDVMSPSNRARFAGAQLYSTASDAMASKALDLTFDIFTRALKPMTGKCIGAVEGHHFFQMKEGDTTDMRLCQMLNTTFLGTSAMIRLVIVRGKSTFPLWLWIHHGVGSGQTGYYPLARLEKVVADWEDVTFFVMGHSCKSAVEPKNRLKPTWRHDRGEAIHRKVYLIGAGGYSKNYVEGSMEGRIPRGGYAEQKMYSAMVLGTPTIKIRPRIVTHKGQTRWEPEIRVET